MKKYTLFLFLFFCGLVQYSFAQQDSVYVLVEDSLSHLSHDSVSMVKHDTVHVASLDTLTIAPLADTTEIPQLLKESNPINASVMIIPVGMMIHGLWIKGTSGLYSSVKIKEDRDRLFPHFSTRVDDYMQYIPAVAAYATGFIPNAQAKHAHGRRLWMLVQAQVFTSLSVLALKHYTNELRPNGEDSRSFPSGHTAQAFMGATFFDMEYPGQMRGVKVGLYAMAGLTGALAVMNDRHWGSDVLFGAGIGMLSVRMLFWSEHYFKHKKRKP